MSTAGNILKQARLKKKKTLGNIARSTKIKEKFLEALENEEWKSLPNLPVSLGFARNFAKAVGVDPEFVSALIRRDFPENKYNLPVINSKIAPQLWTPRRTIMLVIIITLLAVFFYLFSQYRTFVAAPPLEAKVKLESEKVVVSGKTANSATVKIGEREVLVDAEGKFELEMSKNQAGEKIEITATSRAGKQSRLIKTID